MVLTVLITGMIIIVWIIAGRFEWRTPSEVEQKILDWRGQLNNHNIVTIAAIEFDFEDIEKEFYLIRKSAKPGEELVMYILSLNVGEKDTRYNADYMTDNEKTRAKERLEKRFPGLTVKFYEKENIL